MSLQTGVKIYLTPIKDYKTIAKKFIKTGFVIFGIIMVCAGFYNTMIRVHQNHILIRDEVFVKERYTYPSITFCYKYKYGGKDVVQNYLPSLYDKLKASGMFVSLYFSRWILINLKTNRIAQHISLNIPNLIECTMRGIDIYGDDIAVIDDVDNYSECYEHCNERPDCRIWTYVEGSCYMKDENTFKADVNSSVVVGGIKDCQNGKKGNSLQTHIYYSYH